MMLIIALLVTIIGIGADSYTTNYLGKEKPKGGIKRDNPADYFNDYSNLKLYWTSIGLVISGVVVLIAILIMEIVI